MTISHHPPEDLLADFAAGILDEADRLVVAVHGTQCPSCRRFVGAMEHLAGAALEQAAPLELKAEAFKAVMGRIDEIPAKVPVAPAPPSGLLDDDLPEILRRCRLGKKRTVAPGVKLQPIVLPCASGSRAFLLWSAPGTKMLEHSHTGRELTCVLKGSFTHEAGRYEPGDFDFGDGSVDHRPVVDSNEACLCVVAMSGDLKLRGWLGKIVSPFVRF